MAASGAGVMATRSVEVARSHSVKLHVRSTFDGADGTWIREEDEDAREGDHLRGHAHSGRRRSTASRASRPRRSSPRSPRPASTSTRSSRPAPEIVFSAPVEDRADARPRSTGLGARWTRCATTSARSALVGAGMKSHPGVAARHVRDARGRGDRDRPRRAPRRSRSPATSRSADVDRAVQALHRAFEPWLSRGSGSSAPPARSAP